MIRVYQASLHVSPHEIYLEQLNLYLECHAGQVWLNFQVHLLPPPAAQQYHPHPRQGPSRLRKRARRADTRSKASEKATQTTIVEVSVQNDYDQIKVKPVDATAQVESHDHVLSNHATHLPVHTFPLAQHLPD